MNWRAHAFVWLLFAATVVAIFLMDWSPVYLLAHDRLIELSVLAGLAILASVAGFNFSVSGHSVGSRISFVPIFAAALLFPPPAVMILAAISEAAGELKKGRFKAWRAALNIAQASLAYYAAAWVYFTLTSGMGVSSAENGVFFPDITAFLLLVLTFFGLNYLFISFFFALRERQSLAKIFLKAIGPKGGNLWYDFLASPIAVLTALLEVELGAWGLLLVLLPLLLVRYSYMSKIELEAANKDLLTVLIKAIETRDPYTSGHSVRVSQMAKNIAEDMGLPARLVDKVETAALLHDIGKIESLYAEIISKDSALTERERTVIKTHATKGAELLQNLTSFDATVVEGVRHHHERYDGSGYPDGLIGKAIPVAARIIMMCDAVDAMLSDRPYRNALPLAHVRTEMLRCSGTQFDPELVEVVLNSKTFERTAISDSAIVHRGAHERQLNPPDGATTQQATA